MPDARERDGAGDGKAEHRLALRDCGAAGDARHLPAGAAVHAAAILLRPLQAARGDGPAPAQLNANREQGDDGGGQAGNEESSRK